MVMTVRELAGFVDVAGEHRARRDEKLDALAVRMTLSAFGAGHEVSLRGRTFTTLLHGYALSATARASRGNW